MARAPTAINKGFDCKLAAFLRTDTKILSGDYREVPATSAPLIADGGDRSPEQMRDELKAMADVVDAPTLRVMLATARAMIETGAHAA